MTTRIKVRHDTYQNWYDANPTLALGEPGFEVDNNRVKYGDGITAWRDLSYTGTFAVNQDNSINIGNNAGDCDQGSDAIAIGNYAGECCQRDYSIAIGYRAGNCDQGQGCYCCSCCSGGAIAIGTEAGECCQTVHSIAIGYRAGNCDQGDGSWQCGNAIAIGREAGEYCQEYNAIAIGKQAGQCCQGFSAVAIGRSAGNYCQGNGAVAIGKVAGECCQGSNAVAIGNYAGQCSQCCEAVAIGYNAGNCDQGCNAVAIGAYAGECCQNQYAVAVGSYAAKNDQQDYAIAVGAYAAETDISSYTIQHNDQSGTDGSDGNVMLVDESNIQSLRPGMLLENNGYINMEILAITGNVLTLAGTPNNGSITPGGYFNAIARQGQDSIAIGRYAAQHVQHPNSIVINTTGFEANSMGANTTVVKTLRTSYGDTPSGFSPVYYNPTTGELIVVVAA
jgi:hypothetical protein